MEEMREAALAYYANLSEEKKKIAKQFFEAMDGSGEGKVSLKEYVDFFKQKGLGEITKPELFKALDADGNGNLDFDEFITIYYVYMGDRMMFCGECESFLNGLYFTCLQCFDGCDHTFDLCCACYRNMKFHHHEDATFLDNYTLLRRKRNRAESPIGPHDFPSQEDESTELEDAISTVESTGGEDAIETVIKKKGGVQAMVKKGAVTKIATKFVAKRLWGTSKQYAKSASNSISNSTTEIGSSVAAKTSSQLSKIGDKAADAVSSCNLM